MITLIEQVQVFAPQDLGINDVAFCGNTLLAIESKIKLDASITVNRIDGRNKVLLPGFIDALVHVSGGGGEGGFHTRTPQMSLTDATLAGVTTVIGALGTDDVTRTLEDLLAKTYALQNEGLSAYMHTGSYQVPVVTLTGSIRKDLVCLPAVIGVGEVAIADHRSSHPSVEELTRIASDARVGGMLSGKKGTLFLHLGDDAQALSLALNAIESSALPASQFYATHINRNQALLNDAVEFARLGGFVDMTTSTTDAFIEQGEIPAAKAVVNLLEKGVDLAQITMSSDGNASLPIFEDNALIGLEVGRVASLFESAMALTELIGLEQAIQTVTINPAHALGLNHKGQIGADFDVDLILLDGNKIDSVWAKGRQMVEDGNAIVTGTFE